MPLIQPVLLPAGGGPLLVAAELLEAAVGGEGVAAVPRPRRHRLRAGRAPHDGGRRPRVVAGVPGPRPEHEHITDMTLHQSRSRFRDLINVGFHERRKTKSHLIMAYIVQCCR